MGTRIYVTMVGLTYTAENGETLEINEYIFGRINGIKYGVCDVPNGGKELGSTVSSVSGFRFINTRCTNEQYETFKNIIEQKYPGLCTFDVK